MDHIRVILRRADAVFCEENVVKGILSEEVLEYLADLSDGDGILIGMLLIC
jgi:hypothetical protein